MLSSRAKQLLERGSRSSNPRCPLEIGQDLLDAGYSAFDPVIEALSNFGGYSHSIGATGTFKIYTIKSALKHTDLSCNSDDPEEFRIAFGKHPRAQFNFWLNGHGEVLADSIPISNSVTQWVESFAIQEKVERWKNCVRIVLPEPSKGFASWANAHLKTVPAASGKYEKWWLGTEWALHRFLPWTIERNEHWNWLYATSFDHGERLARSFTEHFDLIPSSGTEWP